MQNKTNCCKKMLMAAKNNNKVGKCYNSVSCILSVLIIVFVIGSIIWDMTVTKPAMRQSIDDIKTEVKVIHSKLNKVQVIEQKNLQDYPTNTTIEQ